MKKGFTYSLIMTMLVMLVVILGMVLHQYAGIAHPIMKFLVPGLVVAAGVFVIVRISFSLFIEKKIDPIYRTVHSFTMPGKGLRKKTDRRDLITDLNQEVQVWADNQSREINKLRQLEKYRKDFLGNVSHELKTPIFNIQGYILTLLDGGMEDESINRLYLKRAERSANRLISIVEDLDSIARLESGEFKLKLEPLNLVRLVEEVIEYQEMQAGEKNVKIGFDRNYNRPVKVMADRKRIMEVISNLISNSIKYGKEGGRTIIGFTDTGENILVDITDNGIGIEEKNLPRIFERFYRVDKSRSRESGGTGLGLSIVKHIIQAHNQTITVRSRVNQGTTFIFSLDKA